MKQGSNFERGITVGLFRKTCFFANIWQASIEGNPIRHHYVELVDVVEPFSFDLLSSFEKDGLSVFSGPWRSLLKTNKLYKALNPQIF